MRNENDDHCEIWLARLISNTHLPFLNSIFVKAIMVGFLPSGSLVLFVIIKFYETNIGFLVGYLGIAAWLFFAPYLIWHYDEKLMPDFFNKVRSVINDDDALRKLLVKYDTLFGKKWWNISLPWSGLLCFVVIKNMNLSNVANGIGGYHDPWFWVVLACAFWTGLLSGVGIWGVIITVVAIFDISRYKLFIDPLQPDKLGGLSCFGYYAIGTTLLLSSGCFLVPYAFQVVTGDASLDIYIYIVLIIYSATILISFLLPTIIINNSAKDSRDLYLDEIRKKMNACVDSISSAATIEDKISLHMQRATLRDIYFEHKDVRLYPFEINILIKLITSVGLPLVFMLLQKYILE